MKCRVCGATITERPFASAPPDLAWCTRACWSKEGEAIKERIKKGEDAGFNVRLVKFGKQAGLPE